MLIQHIAAVLGVPVSFFVTPAVVPAPVEDESEETVLRLFTSLTETADRRQFVAMARAFVTLAQQRRAV